MGLSMQNGNVLPPVVPPVNVIQKVDVTPLFKYIFFSALGLIMLSFLASVFMSVFIDSPSVEVQEIIDICNNVVRCGMVSIISLVSGKAF